MQQALRDSEIEDIVLGCCERLFATGLPLVRGFFAFPVLHPLHSAIGVTWLRGKGTRLDGYPHVPGGVSEDYKRSPHYYMLARKLDMLRVRMDKTRQLDFPILHDLLREGVTDYVAFAIGDPEVSRLDGMFGSWATDRRNGFSDRDIEALLRVQDRLAVSCKVAIRRQLMRNIATTYLGNSTSEQVLDGHIRRGDAESIEAAIWYCDLRGSTHMADQLAPQDYIDNLNTFFEAMGRPVREAGGEILSFVGDGLLAIFESRGRRRNGMAVATQRAHYAAAQAMSRMAEVNKTRQEDGGEELGYGIALHAGKVLYGNVGLPERLTFSVFGPAVNEVVRLETLTKTLGHRLLASDRFVELLGAQSRPLGSHALRGVERHMTVHALGEPMRRPRASAPAKSRPRRRRPGDEPVTPFSP